MSDMRTAAGRLREACVLRIHELRGAFDPEGKPKEPDHTYQEIAVELELTVGTVYNVCTGRTHRDLVPLGHPRRPLRCPHDR